LTRWCGKAGYAVFWHPLLDFKFYEYAGSISAAWIWTRIRRVGQSRKNVMQEELGYLEGGSQTLVDALVTKMAALGCRIHLGTSVKRVTVQDCRATGVDLSDSDSEGSHIAADYIISTIPVQQIPSMVPDLPSGWRERYAAIHNIGICCVIFKLGRSISPHFWVNISDNSHEIPGVIEFSNLRKMEPAIIYVPYYMPVTNKKFSWTDQQLIDDAFACIMKLNPEITAADLITARVSRLRHAQPVCEVGFASKIPPVQTPIHGLQIADTCFYYPEDRGIAESVRLGRNMARAIPKDGIGV
jgi:protoporphyrinogen oxidase